MIRNELLVRLLEISDNARKPSKGACIGSMFQVRKQGGGLSTRNDGWSRCDEEVYSFDTVEERLKK